MNPMIDRRAALAHLGLAAGTATWLAADAAAAPDAAAAVPPPAYLPPGTKKLATLAERLAQAPRRRDFKTVPMILEHEDQWDAAALHEVITYGGGPKQVWDMTDLTGPWLNLMRNSLNTQIWAWKHPEFLVVSATHGGAHLALFDEAMWQKYELGRLVPGAPKTNTYVGVPEAAGKSARDVQDPEGVYSPADNSITVLQRRGVVFVGCHNAIWEISEKLIKAGGNPDHLSVEQMAAELTNHLIPGAVLSPGVVGTLPELQRAGFDYAK
jgi:hypothetical protein